MRWWKDGLSLLYLLLIYPVQEAAAMKTKAVTHIIPITRRIYWLQTMQTIAYNTNEKAVRHSRDNTDRFGVFWMREYYIVMWNLCNTLFTSMQKEHKWKQRGTPIMQMAKKQLWLHLQFQLNPVRNFQFLLLVSQKLRLLQFSLCPLSHVYGYHYLNAGISNRDISTSQE